MYGLEFLMVTHFGHPIHLQVTDPHDAIDRRGPTLAAHRPVGFRSVGAARKFSRPSAGGRSPVQPEAGSPVQPEARRTTEWMSDRGRLGAGRPASLRTMLSAVEAA